MLYPRVHSTPAQRPTVVHHTNSRLSTWTRYDHRAPGLQLTFQPGRRIDGYVDDGPPWAKVLRRQTFDMHSGRLLQDIPTKGLSMEQATGPIAYTTSRCRDIITTFYFRPGKWKPDVDSAEVTALPVHLPDEASRQGSLAVKASLGCTDASLGRDSSKAPLGCSDASLGGNSSKASLGCTGNALGATKDASAQTSDQVRPVLTTTNVDWIPMEVQRLQRAMGAPVSKLVDIIDTQNHTDTGIPTSRPRARSHAFEAPP